MFEPSVVHPLSDLFQSTKDLKTQDYVASCKQNNFKMQVPDDPTNPQTTETQTWQECFAKWVGLCECDHLFERKPQFTE